MVLANDLSAKMVQVFHEQVYHIVSVKLIIFGLRDYGHLQEVTQLISSNDRGVKEIYQRNYTLGTTELEVELAGDAESMAADLTTRTFGSNRFVIRESSHNQLQVSVTASHL